MLRFVMQHLVLTLVSHLTHWNSSNEANDNGLDSAGSI